MLTFASVLFLSGISCAANAVPSGSDVVGKAERVLPATTAASVETWLALPDGRRIQVTDGTRGAYAPLERFDGLTVALRGTVRRDAKGNARFVVPDGRFAVLGRGHVKGLEYADGHGFAVRDPSREDGRAKLDAGTCVWLEGTWDAAPEAGPSVFRLYKKIALGTPASSPVSPRAMASAPAAVKAAPASIASAVTAIPTPAKVAAKPAAPVKKKAVAPAKKAAKQKAPAKKSGTIARR